MGALNKVYAASLCITAYGYNGYVWHTSRFIVAEGITEALQKSRDFLGILISSCFSSGDIKKAPDYSHVHLTCETGETYHEQFHLNEIITEESNIVPIS